MLGIILKYSFLLLKNNLKNLSEILEQNINEKKNKNQNTPESSCLFSGECDSLFKIRICGIENLFKLFHSIDPNLNVTKATFNGFTQPSYVTIARQGAEEKEEGKHGKEEIKNMKSSHKNIRLSKDDMIKQVINLLLT